MKILLFYFNKNINSSLDLFLNNCIDKEKITEKIIINKIDKKLQNLNMKQYYEEFIKYD